MPVPPFLPRCSNRRRAEPKDQVCWRAIIVVARFQTNSGNCHPYSTLDAICRYLTSEFHYEMFATGPTAYRYVIRTGCS